jgi:hypothetical protein
MQYQWILDVLDDLKDFARANGLAALAEQLEDTSLVAVSDIARVAGLAAAPVTDIFRGAPRARDAAGRDPS